MANGTQTSNVEQGKWFQLYKPTQGYWTRMGTAIGGGGLILWGASWIFNRLEVYRGTEFGLYLQVISALIYIIGLGLLLYWVVGKNASTVDFFISVEGEMKKVNWSSWPEIVGATKVVILFVILMAIILFIVDTFFMLSFSQMGILKGPGFSSVLEGIGHFFKGIAGR